MADLHAVDKGRSSFSDSQVSIRREAHLSPQGRARGGAHLSVCAVLPSVDLDREDIAECGCPRLLGDGARNPEDTPDQHHRPTHRWRHGPARPARYHARGRTSRHLPEAAHQFGNHPSTQNLVGCRGGLEIVTKKRVSPSFQYLLLKSAEVGLILDAFAWHVY